jgi:hypothetical protein
MAFQLPKEGQTNGLRFKVGDKFQVNSCGFVNGQIIKLWDAGYVYSNELEDEEREQMSGRLKIKIFISGREPLNEYIIVECLAGDAGGGMFMSITYRDIALISSQKNSEVKEVNHIIFRRLHYDNALLRTSS